MKSTFENILFVIDNLGPGGAQRQMVEMAIAFKERGIPVSFLTYHQHNYYEQVLRKSGIEFTSIIEQNYLKRLIRMRQFIRKGNFKGVLSFLTAANFICIISGFPLKNWTLIVGERSANPIMLKKFKSKFYRFFYPFADYVVANSFANLKLVRKVSPFLKQEKCKVFYNIIDFNKWKPNDHYVYKKSGKYRFIIAASHLHLKNLDGLIEAVNLLSDQDKVRLDFHWYGDRIIEPFYDNSFPEAIRKINSYRLNNIFRFYPATHDINLIIAEADAVILLSKYEGLPNTICEGMACGKPVICSKISDIPQLLSYDKNFLCDSDSAESIAKAIKYFLEMDVDGLQKSGNVNHNIALKHFGKQKIVDAYLKLLLE